MRNILLLALLLCLPVLSTAAPQPAGDRTVVAEGHGPTPKEALLQAKRSAVEEGIGVVLSSETETENFMLKKDRVITQSFGAVRSYTILKEEQQASSWSVRISAVVSLDTITRDLMALKILLVSMDKPRTMVLVQEENGQNAGNAIVDYLRGKGFDVVDPAQAAALMAKDDPQIEKAIAGDPVTAARLGAEHGAEYVVVGRVKTSLLDGEVVKGTGLKSGQATLTVKVVNCSNGHIVAARTASGAAVHVADDVAMAQAAVKAATSLMDSQLFEAIVKSFQDAVNNGASYDLVITGVGNYGLQKSATSILEGTEGVVSVTRRSFGGGRLELTVQFQGSVDTLCDRVDSRPAGDARLLVTEVAGNRVALNLQAGGGK